MFRMPQHICLPRVPLPRLRLLSRLHRNSVQRAQSAQLVRGLVRECRTIKLNSSLRGFTSRISSIWGGNSRLAHPLLANVISEPGELNNYCICTRIWDHSCSVNL